MFKKITPLNKSCPYDHKEIEPNGKSKFNLNYKCNMMVHMRLTIILFIKLQVCHKLSLLL